MLAYTFIVNYLGNSYSLNENELNTIRKYQCMLYNIIETKQMCHDNIENDILYKIVAYIFEIQKDYKNMKKYYLMAIKMGNSKAMNNLGSYFSGQKDYSNMKKYYLMAIEKGESKSMYNLGNYYQEQCDYENMTKYYLMAIENKNSNAMKSLGNYYKKKRDYENMKKYYWMAIGKGNNDAVLNLGIYCGEYNDYNEMKKYYTGQSDIKTFNEGVFIGEKWRKSKTG